MRQKIHKTGDMAKLRRNINTAEDYQYDLYHNIYLLAAEARTNGSASSLNQIPSVILVSGADRYARFGWQIPKNWQSGVVEMTVFVRPSTATSGNVYLEFELQGLAVPNNTMYTLINNVNVTQAIGTTQYEIYAPSASSGTLTLNQNLNERGNVGGCRFERLGTNGADTYAGDLHVHGVLLEWKPETYRA